MTVHILMTTDHNYISQVKVAIYSACKNSAQGTDLAFTILCNRDLDKRSRERLLILKEIFPNVCISFYEVEEKDFINATSDYRVPIVSYYRLICAKVLDVQKAIFLDSDVIVNMDLTELYDINMKNYYVAGVRDLCTILNPNLSLWYSEHFNIKNFSDYINCGVLLMNLELMRRDNIVDIFLNELKHKSLWVDQDIINRVCTGKIYLIGWRFNHIAFYTEEEHEWNCKPREKKADREIIHFCGPDKPWENRFSRMADVWWLAARDALETDIYENLYRTASMGSGSGKLAQIAARCLIAERIMIVGYSEHGVFVKNSLLKYGVTGKILFCDNNPKKRSLMLIDDKIYALEEAAKELKSAIWINAVQKQREEIREQLRTLEVPDEQIVNYFCE